MPWTPTCACCRRKTNQTRPGFARSIRRLFQKFFWMPGCRGGVTPPLQPGLFTFLHCTRRLDLKRENISSGSKWEPILGYSRAVKVGQFVFVAGTTGSNSEGKVEGDAHDQTEQAL